MSQMPLLSSSGTSDLWPPCSPLKDSPMSLGVGLLNLLTFPPIFWPNSTHEQWTCPSPGSGPSFGGQLKTVVQPQSPRSPRRPVSRPQCPGQLSRPSPSSQPLSTLTSSLGGHPPARSSLLDLVGKIACHRFPRPLFCDTPCGRRLHTLLWGRHPFPASSLGTPRWGGVSWKA